MRIDVVVSDKDFELIDTFRFEHSWMKNPDETVLNAVERVTYLENLAHAAAYLEACARQKQAVENEDPKAWPDGWQLGIKEAWEMPENTRDV